jgi:hypothetical protein
MSEGIGAALRARLERAAVRDRDLDREIATDWLAADRETWQGLDRRQEGGKEIKLGRR